MVFSIFCRGHLLHFDTGVDDAENEDGSTDVEGVDDRVGDDALRCRVADAHVGEEEGEKVAYEAACVAQETLDGVGQTLLFFIYHVAHHHFKGLHGHVDGGVEEHEGNESEYHGRADLHAEAAGIG